MPKLTRKKQKYVLVVDGFPNGKKKLGLQGTIRVRISVVKNSFFVIVISLY